MKISLNSIRSLNRRHNSAGDLAPDSVDKLVEKIGAQLGAIEEIIDIGKRYEGILIVKVVSCVDHPDADRLHLCKVDDGGVAQGVERDEKGHAQVVCGAPNVHEGMLAAWLPPGSTVPTSYGDQAPFVLEAREIRGQKSNGMMASPKELAIGDSHEGILEIDGDHKPGTDFAEAFGLNDDVIIDIENKMFTHRPDCFGFLGVARELAGIQSQPFKSPEWYQMTPNFPEPEADILPLEVINELPGLVPRFAALAMSGVQLSPSPVWLQVELAKVGQRSINNIVDYTNYFMLQTGQPLHAYDYDKVKALSDGDQATIVVRNPKPGEKIALLNGKTIEPRPEAIMIATDKRLVGVGGVMGGGDTEVDANTKNIILECANFDMYSIRRTSMAHGLFTDAVTRFNKGQSPLQNLAVLVRIVDEIRQHAGGKVASQLIDDNHLDSSVMERQSMYPPVTIDAEFINSRLGLTLSSDEMKTLLEDVEFKVNVSSDELTVAAPFWRTDIELREDVVEEIGRLYGYDKLSLELPKRDLTPVAKDAMFELKSKLRQTLSNAGANEVLTYSFVHSNLLNKVGQDKDQAFQLSNALSPDLQYYRLSLTPSLLDKVHSNIKAGYDEFALFELGKTHDKTAHDDNDLPLEFDNLALVYASNKKASGAAYYQAQKFLTDLAKDFGMTLEFRPLSGAVWSTDAPFELTRSAVICQSGSEQGIGVVGELKASVRRNLKLPDNVAAFELGIGALLKYGQSSSGYVALPRFPKVEQDICLKVATDMPYRQLFELVQKQSEAAKPENSRLTVEPLDIYQREDDAAHKQITFRLSVASYDRTLTDVEVNKLLDQVAAAAQEKFGAERI